MQKNDNQKETLPPPSASSPPVMQRWPARTGHPMHLANALVGSGIVVVLLMALPFIWHAPSKRVSCLGGLAAIGLLTAWKWIQVARSK